MTRLDAALQLHEDFFIRCGIFLMLEKLRSITFRTLFKKVLVLIFQFQPLTVYSFLSVQLLGDSRVPLKAFMSALRFQGIDDVDDDELECIVANLIAEVCVLWKCILTVNKSAS